MNWALTAASFMTVSLAAGVARTAVPQEEPLPPPPPPPPGAVYEPMEGESTPDPAPEPPASAQETPNAGELPTAEKPPTAGKPPSADPAPGAQASPQVPAPKPKRRNRFYLQGALGAGLFRGIAMGEEEDGIINGASVSWQFLLGGSIGYHWAFGASYVRDHVGAVSLDGNTFTAVDAESGIALSNLGVFVDWHPLEEDGLHFQLHVAFSTLSVDDGLGSDAADTGVGWVLAAGYDYRLSDKVTLGALFRVNTGAFRVSTLTDPNEFGWSGYRDVDTRVVAPSLLLTLTLR